MTLDERLQRAAQEVQDRFEALEPLHVPATETRRRPRLRSGPVVAAAAFVAVVVLGATLLWLGPFAGENPDVANEITPPKDVTVTSLSPDDAVIDTPTTVTTTPTPTTTTAAGRVLAPPIEGCQEWKTEWLSARGRDCDLVQGEEVPILFGPLLDGGWFDLTDLRGRPAIVLTSVASYGPGNRDAIAEFQVLYDKWSDRIGFVNISEDHVSVARDVVEEGGFTFPVVTCFSDEPIPPNGNTLLCSPAEHTTMSIPDGDIEVVLWVWWGNQDLPSWTILDSDGRFVDLRLGGSTTLEEIDSLLASVVGSQNDGSG